MTSLKTLFNWAVNAGRFNNLFANPINSVCLFLVKDQNAVVVFQIKF
jgi:hypothetical protein